MAESSTTLALHTATAPSDAAGWRLRKIRERLKLTLRDVEECSLEISDAENNSDYFVSIARLNQIENDDSLPSIFKLYTLAAAYHMTLEQVLLLYGVDPAKMEEHWLKSPVTRTHLLPPGNVNPARTMRFPVRFDPGFRPEKTIFLSRVIESWGEIPVGLLASLDLKKHRYGYIGLEDRSMTPLIRPGSIVQIDESRCLVKNQGWVSEAERPIYFLELRYSYECCWCHQRDQRGRELTLIFHSLSARGPRTIRIPEEGEVLGQVVGVAMRLVE